MFIGPQYCVSGRSLNGSPAPPLDLHLPCGRCSGNRYSEMGEKWPQINTISQNMLSLHLALLLLSI